MLVMRLMASLAFGQVVLGPALSLASSSLACYLEFVDLFHEMEVSLVRVGEDFVEASFCAFSSAMNDLTCISRFLLFSMSVCICAARLSTVAIA